MPYKVTKVGKGKFKVTSPHGVKTKAGTKKNTAAQVRLLQAIEHNPDFKPRKGR